ncbi:KaiC domain-containing protein [Halorubrum salsamenti]|uniref:KaiC domain-containing protein n=1 Tax=Halorubrum salsamenti TaxID=2583990 RepID=UPI0011A01C97|nr:KaiC domain-containing protein [Halorubrum salsamenti]
MSEEDDWFERALRDIDEEPADTADSDEESGAADSDEESGAAEEPSDSGEPDDGAGERESDPFGGIRRGERDPSRDAGDGLDDGEPDSDGFDGGEFGDGESGGDDPFGGDGSGDDPFGGEPPPSDDENRDETRPDPFGGGSFGDDDPFGGESADPFGGYRGNAAGGSGGPNDVGFDEFGGGEGGDASPGFDVDPDEFESSIERTDIGIEGLDEMILGGVPRRSLLSVIGGAGTGKTTFALQFLNEALESDRKGIYITLEQTRESILSTAEEKGWSFREHAEEDRLAVVAIDPIEMANSLASIRNDLVRLISEFDADRLVLDSVSLLEMMYDHPAKRRSEVFGFTRSLKDAGVTTLLTSEASETNPYASRHGIVEYLTDAVFVLQYVRGTDFRETRLAVEIQKIRDANHSRQSKPYEITDTGISVYGQANIF